MNPSRCFHHLRRSLTGQRGAYTVIGLIFLVGFVVPAILVLQSTALLSNSSSQAEGMAYNLSYGALNRAIDHDATNAGNQVQLAQQDGGVYSDLIRARQAMEEAGKSGATKDTRYELEQFGEDQAYGGPNTSGQSRVAGLTNVTMSPSGAQLATSIVNVFSGRGNNTGCYPSSGHALYAGTGASENLLCWQDLRGLNRGGGTAPDPFAWSHFSSGAQVNLRATVPLPLVGDTSLNRVGVATFSRPCTSRAVTCENEQ